MPTRELTCEFGGWFMCRLATDPDPTDEPRGVSGSTFALAGEPDLDRIIVLGDPRPEVRRSHMPPVGVTVTRAAVGAVDVPELTGARVDLLGDPVFENRNTVLTFAGREPIVPFHLRISAPGARIERRMLMWSDGPEDPPVHLIPRAQLEKFGGRVFRTDPDLIRSATGIADPLLDREERHRRLVEDLERETDPVRRAGTEKRVRELEIGLAQPADERVVNMTAIEEFRFPLTGEADVEGEALTDLAPDTRAPWTVDFWMGGWDPDVMCGYFKGSLTVPLREDADGREER
ncbi:hypothetical protein K7472_10350 [Streptomyces sp. PTM05]|uniref:Uncharacterized protein n=1 Tax=Streptantibioticus parmotrematis TaxID=2873249 RepID=A0ABS7QPX2_9ACTN|nr:hypothetical protein [Streptantibioticus parmotrematis]MBY8885245.1 hypothetical protein [Streptantibioticus parmotrematis]